jgi:leucyl aminopeptidase (aminopeptidase T)
MVRCALGTASEPQAAYWKVSATTWRGQILRASLEPSLPQLQRDAKRVRAALAKGRTLRVTSASGTDFTIGLKRAPPWIEDGGFTNGTLGGATCPAGRAIAITEPSTAEGILIGSRASYLPTGRADGGQWEFRDGRVASAWFTEGYPEFTKAFECAAKGHDAVSSLAIGLNPSVAPGTPEFEDHEAGAVTIAMGENRAIGGTNGCGFSAWIVVGEATVTLDGNPLYDRGKLL